MMTKRTYFKAVRPNGASFYDDTFRWNVEPGGVTEHPAFSRELVKQGDAYGYLSVATVATDCTGFRWPCRLLEVEAVGQVFTPNPSDLPNKRAARAFRTVRELPAWQVFGPQCEQMVALIDAAKNLTRDQADALSVAWYAARDAGWYAARDAACYVARGAARAAAWDVAWDVAWDAAWAAARAAAWDVARSLTLRDLVGTDDWSQEAYDTLTRSWRTIVGPIHPDDPDLR